MGQMASTASASVYKTIPPAHGRRSGARTRSDLLNSYKMPVPPVPPALAATFDPQRYGCDVRMALAVPVAGGHGSINETESADDGRQMRK